MKIARTFTIDEELVKLLNKEENASELICRLLRVFFTTSQEDIKDMTIEETEMKLKEVSNKINAYRELNDIEGMKKFEEQEQRLKNILEIMKNKEKIVAKDNDKWEKQKERNKLKHELRKKYEKEVPADKQNAVGLEEYFKNNGVEDETP